jgi:hypothetical protein
MNLRFLSLCAGSALAFAACSNGGASNALPAPSSGATTQQVSGTIAIGLNGATNTTSSGRARPAYVSSSTTHAYVFINGSAAPNNASSSCTSGSGTTGAGTFCTINWTANLAVPGSYTFAVETDNGSSVLAEGAATYTIVAGSNTLSALTLNGVAAEANFTTSSCSAASVQPGTCNGTVTLLDAAGNTIEYTGTSVVPTVGNSPSTGTVFDDGNVTFSGSTPNGLVIGSAQSSGGNTFSTYASNVLTVGGVINAAGAYNLQVQCATASTSGVIGIAIGGGASPSHDVTAAELTSENPAPSYPSSIATVATAPSYTCTTGVISSATGTLPVN